VTALRGKENTLKLIQTTLLSLLLLMSLTPLRADDMAGFPGATPLAASAAEATAPSSSVSTATAVSQPTVTPNINVYCCKQANCSHTRTRVVTRYRTRTQVVRRYARSNPWLAQRVNVQGVAIKELQGKTTANTAAIKALRTTTTKNTTDITALTNRVAALERGASGAPGGSPGAGEGEEADKGKEKPKPGGAPGGIGGGSASYTTPPRTGDTQVMQALYRPDQTNRPTAQLAADSDSKGEAAKPTRFAIVITASDYVGNRVAGAKFQLVQGDKVLFTTQPTGPKGITWITNVPVLSEDADDSYEIVYVEGTPTITSFSTEGRYEVTDNDMKVGDEGNLKTVEGKPLPQLELFFKVLGPRDTYVAASTARTNSRAAARLAEVAMNKAQRTYENTQAIRMSMVSPSTWNWIRNGVYVIFGIILVVIIILLIGWIMNMIDEHKRRSARGSS
jgi:hypothetical protein